REFIGLCPFHNEKTPSFSVVEDQGFYHCFGCGAHGDVISYVMQGEGLGFLDAVEDLARRAGLEVPKPTREEHDRAMRVVGLQGAVEAACGFFEASLHAAEGREARQYLERRGLDEATVRRFRLGFAPDRRDALKRALGGQCPEAMLLEAGLLRRPEGGGESYDYFRGRVMFPIGDRHGRTIAFGGRIMGEGQPKYLNSPDTPLFEKGRVLYGWAQARAAAAREPSAVVVEGYMDVIALHRAGFATAVAPLGTALTETQIEELWRLAPEPILCFDGDAAGQRAAARALDRALPLLKPGLSLRFAALPEGEDPDTLVLRHGAAAMREVLDQARPLAEVLWSLETAHNLDTPERRAALEKRIDGRVRLIADRGVQDHYRDFFRDRVARAFGRRAAPFAGKSRFVNKSFTNSPRPAAAAGAAPKADPQLLSRRPQQVVLACLLNHPFLLNEFAEEIAGLELPARDLDRLLRETLEAHRSLPDLDAERLKFHLRKHGFHEAVDGVVSKHVINTHGPFAQTGVDADAVRAGFRHTVSLFQRRTLTVQVKQAERDLAANMSHETWAQVQPLIEEKVQEDGSTDGGIR
ncbi:MAG TPA: DNA primase, partial [Xanthobacteraceae bacterium]|nr:DNA primase [Xanthobacteraceae bacterium]